MFGARFLALAALTVCASTTAPAQTPPDSPPKKSSSSLPSSDSLSKKSLSSSSSSPKPDPIAAELAREAAAFKALPPDSDDLSKQTREAFEPLVVRAEDALRDGRRLLALQRLAVVYPNVEAVEYMSALPVSKRGEQGAFEAEWARSGPELTTPGVGGAGSLKPAAVRALAEAALPQAKVFYDASLEYARNTMAESGFFYIGSARGQIAFGSFLRSLSEPGGGRELRLRSLAPDIDALEHELLAAYEPPASIDRHVEFILASSLLNEARVLDAAGLRHGALLRLLQTALRVAALKTVPSEDGALADKVAALRARVSVDGVDHTIARIFLESAESDLAAAKPGAPPTIAAGVVSEVIPRYFAAIGPAPRTDKRPDPVATITLVRWPYT
jgi:hypothetical protein